MSISILTDVGSHITNSVSITPRAQTAATVEGSGIDRCAPGDQQYQSCQLFVSVGPTTGTPDSFSVAVTMEDSADNLSFAAMSPAVAITTITAINTSQYVNVNLKGARRYVRAVAVVAFVGGTSPTVGIAANVTLGGATKLPV